MTISAPPRRRWFQFSIRTLFVLVTLAGFASPFIPQMVAWLFPPKDDLREASIKEFPDNLSIIITHGQGLRSLDEPMDRTDDEDDSSALSGDGFF